MEEEKQEGGQATKEDQVIENSLDMGQDQIVHISDNCSIIRVHGGWIYVFYALVNYLPSEGKYNEIHISHTQFVKDERKTKI